MGKYNAVWRDKMRSNEAYRKKVMGTFLKANSEVAQRLSAANRASEDIHRVWQGVNPWAKSEVLSRTRIHQSNLEGYEFAEDDLYDFEYSEMVAYLTEIIEEYKDTYEQLIGALQELQDEWTKVYQGAVMNDDDDSAMEAKLRLDGIKQALGQVETAYGSFSRDPKVITALNKPLLNPTPAQKVDTETLKKAVNAMGKDDITAMSDIADMFGGNVTDIPSPEVAKQVNSKVTKNVKVRSKKEKAVLHARKKGAKKGKKRKR